MDKTKLCTKCQIEKPTYEFGPRKGKPDGLKSWCRLCETEYQRLRYAANIVQNRERKKLHMRKARQDPVKRERYNAARRGVEKYIKRQKDYLAKMRQDNFFVWRARSWSARFHVPVTAVDLWKLWKEQRGRCALSGRKLSATAHLDHIINISKKGKHTLDNIRWLDPQVNLARRELSDKDFIELCHQVVALSDNMILSPSH